MSNLNKWDQRFFDLAKNVSTWSKDPNCQVGAVIISPCKKHITFGFNGFPSAVRDDNRLNTEEKNGLMVHAEVNAIINAQTNLKGWTLYCNKFPCLPCCLAIIQTGISKVVAPDFYKYITDSKWFEPQLKSMELMREAGINIILAEGEPCSS